MKIALLAPPMGADAIHPYSALPVFNAFNHANQINFTGVKSSPFFGRATAAMPGRRMEVGMRFSF